MKILVVMVAQGFLFLFSSRLVVFYISLIEQPFINFSSKKFLYLVEILSQFTSNHSQSCTSNHTF